jgi:hypothetical protein
VIKQLISGYSGMENQKGMHSDAEVYEIVDWDDPVTGQLM